MFRMSEFLGFFTPSKLHVLTTFSISRWWGLNFIVNMACQVLNKNTSSDFPKFSDRQVWANSADPDQTAPRGAV